MKYLSVNDVLVIHNELVKMFATEADPIFPPGPRDNTLLGSAVSRPQTALGGTEKYRSVEAKAAALFHSLVKNHAFHNGNKRTALVSLLVFLEQNERRMEVSDDELFDFVLSIADDRIVNSTVNGTADEIVEAIRKWIADHSTARRFEASTMQTKEFLEGVQQAGGTCADSKESWVIRGPNGKSIRISQSSRRLEGSVVRKYLSKLGLSYGQSGIHLDEFQKGIDTNQQLMRRFRNVLKRLAHA